MQALVRAVIVERINAGLCRARAQGKRLGRPRVDAKVEAVIRRELAKGHGIHAVARTVGVGAARCSGCGRSWRRRRSGPGGAK